MKPKPFLRWAGSKRKLIPKLQPYWRDNFSRYVEPFVGSACLFYSIQPRTALLSDINSELIETYKFVKSSPKSLYNKLKQLPVDKDYYYSLRKKSPEKMSEINRVTRFLYLNQHCFNGLYRTNNSGKFNVPFTKSGKRKFPSFKDFERASLSLKNAEIRTSDFEKILLEDVKEGDFVYLDPPYAVSNRRIFVQYGPQTFGLKDLDRLKTALLEIEKRGSFFVLSYAFCKEIRQKFSNWNMKKVFTQRNISGFSKHRRRAAELIISNIEPVAVKG